MAKGCLLLLKFLYIDRSMILFYQLIHCYKLNWVLLFFNKMIRTINIEFNICIYYTKLRKMITDPILVQSNLKCKEFDSDIRDIINFI